MTMPDVQAIALQVAKAIGYYVILVVMMRLAGKRLAGQTTTFDLIVLITLGATVQNAMVGHGPLDTTVFVVVVSRPNIVKSPMTNANATRPPITQPI